MINIQIKTNGKNVLDSFDKENTNLEEVGIVLLRLKQIEQKLVGLEFDSDLEVKKE